MKILAIGAHFDDVELGCGGTLLKHKNNGDEIYILTLTKSGYNSKTNNHSRSDEDALYEGKKSAEMLEAKLITGNFPTLELTASKELINFICVQVQQVNPDIVYTHYIGDQHLDHKAVAEASLIATRKVKSVFSYLPNIYDTYPLFNPNFFVDISDFFEQKMDLINNYKSERETHNHWRDQMMYINGIYGIKQGVKFVEAYHTIKIFK